ncbi:hypothetical protein C8Q79DRAFT_992319 [Trametes meyenii]|nr:hypothetical protein C8Q79DRAFT_992319 [Trametes meyenii]
MTTTTTTTMMSATTAATANCCPLPRCKLLARNVRIPPHTETDPNAFSPCTTRVSPLSPPSPPYRTSLLSD